ncbi:Uncharacterised protein [Serratia rubidaea]|nr:Uncharacterised protein [Serratia rubidaea]
MTCEMVTVMIDKYRLDNLRLLSDEKGELARWVIQLQADLDTERRKKASLDSVIAKLEQTLEREREKSRRVMSENQQQAQRIAELEAAEKVWESAAQKHIARAEAAEQRIAELEEKYSEVSGWYVKMKTRMLSAEKRLATPVRLPQLCGDGDNDTEYTEGLNDGITQSAIYLRRQGFKVEGDV